MTYGRLAQLVEHLLDVQEVTGSSPVPSTTSPQTKRSGDFFRGGGTGLEQHGHAAGGATNTPVQRRRPQPAAETGRSCWGSVLIFQSPAKGLQKNQQTQPVALISARFPTHRNVYQERCRQTHSSRVFLFWWTVQDENRDKQRQGIIVVMVSCLLLILTVYGILGLVQQIGICQGSINPLSQSLTALPAPPRGELYEQGRKTTIFSDDE